ncbi:hypothetical protein ABFA07_009618 [Porites harrisoni]
MDDISSHVMISKYIKLFNELIEAGNLTADAINISISLVEELTELIMLEMEVSFNQSEIKNQLSTLVTTVDEILNENDAATWRTSGMIMNLVEAVEKTLSLALNFSSSINQSLLWDRRNLDILTSVEYILLDQRNITIPNSKDQDIFTGFITFQPSNGGIETPKTSKGRFIVGIVVFNNLTSHFTKKHQPSNNRKDDGQLFLNSEIISVIASYDGKPVQRLKKDALLTFEKKTSDGKEPLCVFWKPVPGEREWSSEGLSLITTNKQQIICSTNHLTSFSILMRWTDVKVSPGDKYALDVITYIGSGVSLVALACAIIIFLCLGRSLSAIRYRIHLNLCIALAVAQVVFLSGIEASSSRWICTTVAVLLHYLYTASFTWMCAEGLHLYFKIVTAFNLHRIKMIYYVILGWGFPVVVVGISATTRIKGYGATDVCWLSLKKGFIWSFIGPVMGIIAFNLLILGLIIKTLVSLSNVAESDPRENRARSGVKAALMLMPLLGTTWVLGLLSVNSDTVVFQYLFAIVNSLQGLFIFTCHCVGNSEVRMALTKLKNRHSTKIAFSREVKSVKPKRKTTGLKGSKFDAEDQTKNIVLLVVDPAELELKDID